MSSLIPKERIWPALIIAALVIDVGVGFSMMRLAADDPHAAVEPDYYRKAITWDSTMAQAVRNGALGWTLVPSLGAVTPTHEAPLTMQLRDSAGRAITGAVIQVEAMQIAHAEEILHATLTGANDSSYTTTLPMARTGLWEMRVIVTRGTDRFTTQLRLDASTSGIAGIVTARPGDAPPEKVKSVVRPAGS